VTAVGPTAIEATTEWLSYAAAPTALGLGRLVAGTRLQDRASLVHALESLFFERGDWRVAQHAALLHLDPFEPHTNQGDLVKALCFAEYACSVSKDDPRARLIMGRVSWERRLPLAVLHDVETARAGEARLRVELDDPRVKKVLAEAFLLEGLARAYLRDVKRAHESLIGAEGFGGLTLEGAIQLLLAADRDFPEASMWAVSLIPSSVDLGGRGGALQQYALRRRLIWLLRTRGVDARS